MKIDEILAWAGPEQFHLNSNDILIENLWDSGLGQPWGISFKFLLRSNWKLMRFWPGLALSTFLYILINFLYIVIKLSNWKLMRFWLGLAPSNFLWILISFWLKIVEVVAWAGPDHVPLNSNWILIENWWDSGLGWPWAISFKLWLHFN